MGKEGHDRAARVSDEGSCGRLGHCGWSRAGLEVSGWVKVTVGFRMEGWEVGSVTCGLGLRVYSRWGRRLEVQCKKIGRVRVEMS